ncbi:MAG: virulence protein RhuM/Fic/DOC family protein [Cyanobacteriota bacterium]|nr:virulence protein RhuM/Fic/DOC family protein [Cyanobacteriota bacterium]
MTKTEDLSKGEIIIYESNGKSSLEVIQQDNTLWLSAEKIGKLFGKDRSNIQRHIAKIYREQELDENSTCAFFAQVQKEGKRTVSRNIPYYNLDVILAVGYRVTSKTATEFRKWATNVLHKYVLEGYAINEHKLKQEQDKVKTLQDTIKLLSRSLKYQVQSLDEAKDVAKLMDSFAGGLDLLDNYDHKKLDVKGVTTMEAVKIEEQEFLTVIDKMKSEFASDVFATPKDESFSSSVNQIYQTFDGKELYPTLEEKAATLLYLIVKNHSFADGNKRIGASCFLYFLNRNNMLYKNNKPIIDNSTLFALTLLIATSKPEEMETVKQIVLSILNRGGEG